MKYRNEWKYIVCDNDLIQIGNKLDKVLTFDEHINTNNKYIIHSLYFDDLNNSCAFDNDAGLSKRHKWRIRYYNNDLSLIKLEKKEKRNGLCMKRSCFITEEQYRDIINNDISGVFWGSNNKLLQEFCVEVANKLYMPKLIIDYERTAFVEPITNVRITFDRNISGSLDIDNFMNGNYVSTPLQDINKHILEIKFDDILPSHIKQAAYIHTLNQTTFSKFYLGRVLLERN